MATIRRTNACFVTLIQFRRRILYADCIFHYDRSQFPELRRTIKGLTLYVMQRLSTCTTNEIRQINIYINIGALTYQNDKIIMAIQTNTILQTRNCPTPWWPHVMTVHVSIGRRTISAARDNIAGWHRFQVTSINIGFFAGNCPILYRHIESHSGRSYRHMDPAGDNKHNFE